MYEYHKEAQINMVSPPLGVSSFELSCGGVNNRFHLDVRLAFLTASFLRVFFQNNRNVSDRDRKLLRPVFGGRSLFKLSLGAAGDQ